MTVGGLITQGIAVSQRAGANPRFSPEVYFVVCAILQAMLLLVMIPIAALKHDDDDGVSAVVASIYEVRCSSLSISQHLSNQPQGTVHQSMRYECSVYIYVDRLLCSRKAIWDS
jgi:hypothetical protein